ncbi:hypothetical protein L6452_14774 [Arctium lappa]|uniref:Uncharacterized protein n=1 Tax=Arctium lappa TaxID=4217 RepID=A0ACB9CLW7_ARCLA|nr:hypothetical protein L6452_14774 [Arctium lappa]
MASSTIAFSSGQNLGFLRPWTFMQDTHRHRELPVISGFARRLIWPSQQISRGCLLNAMELALTFFWFGSKGVGTIAEVGSKGVGTCFQVLRQIWMKAFELLRRVEMGLIRTFLGFSGFGIGVSAGLVIGCYLFIYFQPTDVKDPIIRPLVERDSETLQSLLPEKPLWVNNPDFDRCVCRLLSI